MGRVGGKDGYQKANKGLSISYLRFDGMEFTIPVIAESWRLFDDLLEDGVRYRFVSPGEIEIVDYLRKNLFSEEHRELVSVTVESEFDPEWMDWFIVFKSKE